MSLKVERDTIRTVDGAEQMIPKDWPKGDLAERALEKVTGVGDGPIPGTSGKHPHLEVIGTALTGGRKTAGTKGYLGGYLKELEDHPLRTKMLTAGSLAGLQELLASWLAKDRNKHNSYLTARIPKMAAYGALISAPLGHFLIWLLQKAFSGRTSLKAKILQIFVSNLLVCFDMFLDSKLLPQFPFSNTIETVADRMTDCSYPKHGLSYCHGPDCRR